MWGYKYGCVLPVCLLMTLVSCGSAPSKESEDNILYLTAPGRYVIRHNPGSYAYLDDGHAFLYSDLRGYALKLYDTKEAHSVSLLDEISKVQGIRDFCYAKGAARVFFSTNPDHMHHDTLKGLQWKGQDMYSWTLGAEKPAFLQMNIGYTYGMDASDDGRTLVYSAITDRNELAGNIWVTRYDDSFIAKEKEQFTFGSDHEMCPLLYGDNEGIVFFRSNRFGNNSPIATPRWRRWRVYAKPFGSDAEMELSKEAEDYLYWPSVSRDRRWFFYATDNQELSDLKFHDMEKSVFNVEWPELQAMFPKVGDGGFHNAYDILDPQFTFDSKGFIVAIKDQPPEQDPRKKMEFIVVRLDLETGKVRQLATLPGISNGIICSANEEELYVSEEQVRTDTVPRELYRVSIEKSK